MIKTDMERLLEASLTISQLKRQATLSAAAIEALREELQSRDNELALLRARLRVSDIKMQRVPQHQQVG